MAEKFHTEKREGRELLLIFLFSYFLIDTSMGAENGRCSMIALFDSVSNLYNERLTRSPCPVATEQHSIRLLFDVTKYEVSNHEILVDGNTETGSHIEDNKE